MQEELGRAHDHAACLDRRTWLRAAAAGSLGFVTTAGRRRARAGQKGDGKPDPSGGEPGLNDVRRRLTEAKIGPLALVRSAHYVAVGDAAAGFMRVILEDCEQLVDDYLRHFRQRGFAVHPPQDRLIVVMFQDDRSFRKFFHLHGGIGVPALTGLYDRKTNVLHVFDWRNVPMASRASHQYIHTLSHEGTHQLSFNTGLLRRDGDVPLCIVEGLGTYGEARQTNGPSDMGRLNLERLDDLARRQRQVPWIPLRDLLTQDQILRSGSTVPRSSCLRPELASGALPAQGTRGLAPVSRLSEGDLIATSKRPPARRRQGPPGRRRQAGRRPAPLRRPASDVGAVTRPALSELLRTNFS